MEESQTSESVAVLPDMSEPLTSETEEATALTSEHEAHPVAVTASVTSVPGVTGVPGVGVPVSLPVGSIIGVSNSAHGATFNVITSDQLQVRLYKVRIHTPSKRMEAILRITILYEWMER